MTNLIYTAFDIKKPLFEDDKDSYETEEAMMERIRNIPATPLPVLRPRQDTQVDQQFVNLQQLLNSLEPEIDKSLFEVDFTNKVIKYGPVTFGEPYYSRVLGLQGLIRPMHDYITEANVNGTFDFISMIRKPYEDLMKIRDCVNTDDISELARYFGYPIVTVEIADGWLLLHWRD